MYSDAEAAQLHADTSLKAVLMVFSGSDWCKSCMQFEHEVLQSPEFEQLAAPSLILLKVDFPRRKKNQLSPKLQQQNDALAAAYNPEGQFPYLVLRDFAGTVLGKLNYQPHAPEVFLSQLKSLLPNI